MAYGDYGDKFNEYQQIAAVLNDVVDKRIKNFNTSITELNCKVDNLSEQMKKINGRIAGHVSGMKSRIEDVEEAIEDLYLQWCD